MGRPTIRDVALASGVSMASVSKALNPHADRCDLSPATRARILAAARALGFRPSASHSRRTRRLWRNIGLLWGRFAPFTSGVYEGVIDVIGQGLLDRGWRLLYTPVPRPDAWREMQMSQRLDGVVAVSHVPEEILAMLAAERYPAVLLNMVSDRPLPQFLPDDAGGSAAIVAHLAGLGHRRAVYLDFASSGIGHISETVRREALMRSAAAAGMAIEVVRDRAAAIRMCRQGATAVVCYDWSDVPELLGGLRAAGLAVPADVSVVCCADVRWFAYLAPAVTAVRIPMRELAQRAVDHLLARIEAGDPGPERPLPMVMPVELAVRGSTGPAPGPKRPARGRTGAKTGTKTGLPG